MPNLSGIVRCAVSLKLRAKRGHPSDHAAGTVGGIGPGAGAGNRGR